MENNKSFDEIMISITRGLTGNAAEDIVYLNRQMDRYKDHEYGKEILRACGRILYRIIPSEGKEKLDAIMDKVTLGINEALDEARFNVYKKNYRRALKILNDIVEKFERTGCFQDDKVTEYHSFKNALEFFVFVNNYQPEKEIKDLGPDIYQMYLELGSLLFELKMFDEAEKALEKSLVWNPVCAAAAFEYAEIFKVTGKLEKFFEITMDSFDYISEPENLARAYRNLGYYYVEKELYHVAAACNYLSLQYDDESKAAQSELYYIQQITGETMDFPSKEEMDAYNAEYGIPYGPSADVIGVAYYCGKKSLEDGNADFAKFFLKKAYALLPVEEIKKLINQFPEEEE